MNFWFGWLVIKLFVSLWPNFPLYLKYWGFFPSSSFYSSCKNHYCSCDMGLRYFIAAQCTYISNCQLLLLSQTCIGQVSVLILSCSLEGSSRNPILSHAPLTYLHHTECAWVLLLCHGAAVFPHSHILLLVYTWMWMRYTAVAPGRDKAFPCLSVLHTS